MPKVSVLMPVYNVKEEYLRESIESILNQTYSDFEFIILDDCSADDIESVVNSYNDKRIKFFRNKQNLGIAKSRNKLMEHAQGEYAALMDNDDISLPERLEKQVQFLDINPEISIVSAAYETFPKKTIIKQPLNPGYLDLYKGCIITHPLAMFRLDDMKKFNLQYDDSFVCSQDYELWSRAIRYLKIANLPEVLLKYRVLEESVTHQKAALAFEEDTKIRQKMLEFLSGDEEIQNKIKSKYFPILTPKKNSFLQNIFSIRNIEQYKVLTLFGIKIKLRRNK